MYTPVAGAGPARFGRWIEGREEGDERLENLEDPSAGVKMPERPQTPISDQQNVDENGQTLAEQPNDWVEKQEKTEK